MSVIRVQNRWVDGFQSYQCFLPVISPSVWIQPANPGVSRTKRPPSWGRPRGRRLSPSQNP